MTAAPSSPQGRPGGALWFADDGLGRLEKLLNALCAGVIAALMILGVTQIVARKALGLPIPGYIDIVEQVSAVFAFLGAANCQRLGGHVRMDLVLGKLAGRPLWLTELLTTLAALAVISALIPASYEHFLRAYEIGDSTIDLQLPAWPAKLLVPVGLAVLWLRLLLNAIGFVRLALSPAAAPVAVPLAHDLAGQADDEIHDILGDADGDARQTARTAP